MGAGALDGALDESFELLHATTPVAKINAPIPAITVFAWRAMVLLLAALGVVVVAVAQPY